MGKFFLRAIIYVSSIRSRPMPIPGTKPARNRAPTDVFVRLPKTTMVKQGGISTPMPPAEVTRAAAKLGW